MAVPERCKGNIIIPYLFKSLQIEISCLAFPNAQIFQVTGKLSGKIYSCTTKKLNHLY